MSTLTRTNSHSKKPQYKDYVSFLDSYRNSKKDDQHSVATSDSGVNFSLNSSSNNSSNSVFSDVSDGSTINGLKERFHNVNDVKFTFVPPSKGKEQKATVRTEVFIQINKPTVSQKFPTQVFEIQRTGHQEPTISVSNAAKLFEQKDQPDSSKKKQKKTALEELSKKFDAPTVKVVAKRAASIGEVSKIFETGSSCHSNNILHKPKNFNTVPKPFQAQNLQKADTEVKTLVKPAILSPKPVISAPSFPKFIPDPPRSYADSVDSALSSLSISPSPPQCASPPPEGSTLPPPPPPPLPPPNFGSKQAEQRPAYNNTSSSTCKQTSQQQNHQAIGAPPGTSNGTLDKNDPRVKKAVYGALRNMYGAYHDQANDYLSTLPKNRIKKNNGLDSIIDSIASQGGLDKLTGRVIPKQEGD